MKSYPLMWALFHKPLFQDPYISQPVFQFKVSGRFFFLGGAVCSLVFLEPETAKNSSKSSDAFAGPDQEVYEATVRASCQKSLPPYMQPLGDGDVRMGPGTGLGLVPCWSTGIGWYSINAVINGSLERSQNSCSLNHLPSKWKSEEAT